MTFAIGVIDGAGVSPGARAAWVGLIRSARRRVFRPRTSFVSEIDVVFDQQNPVHA